MPKILQCTQERLWCQNWGPSPNPLGRHTLIGRHPLVDTPLEDTPPGRHTHTHTWANTTRAYTPLPTGDGHCSGRYVSYWNAFLFLIKLKFISLQFFSRRQILGIDILPHCTINTWRIQDFSQGGAPTPKFLLFCRYFAENCMKMKEFGPPGVCASLAPPLDPPMIISKLRP